MFTVFARQQQTQCVPMLTESSRLMIHGEWRRAFFSLCENMLLMGILRYLHQFVKSKLESGTSLNIIFFVIIPTAEEKWRVYVYSKKSSVLFCSACADHPFSNKKDFNSLFLVRRHRLNKFVEFYLVYPVTVAKDFFERFLCTKTKPRACQRLDSRLN